MFLTEDEIVVLTGCRQKAKQIEQLRRMGIRFYVNASGHPVVTVAAVEGSKTPGKPAKGWHPKWAGNLA